jgi:hypothetical protein
VSACAQVGGDDQHRDKEDVSIKLNHIMQYPESRAYLDDLEELIDEYTMTVQKHLDPANGAATSPPSPTPNEPIPQEPAKSFFAPFTFKGMTTTFADATQQLDSAINAWFTPISRSTTPARNQVLEKAYAPVEDLTTQHETKTETAPRQTVEVVLEDTAGSGAEAVVVPPVEPASTVVPEVVATVEPLPPLVPAAVVPAAAAATSTAGPPRAPSPVFSLPQLCLPVWLGQGQQKAEDDTETASASSLPAVEHRDDPEEMPAEEDKGIDSRPDDAAKSGGADPEVKPEDRILGAVLIEDYVAGGAAGEGAVVKESPADKPSPEAAPMKKARRSSSWGLPKWGLAAAVSRATACSSWVSLNSDGCLGSTQFHTPS